MGAHRMKQEPDSPIGHRLVSRGPFVVSPKSSDLSCSDPTARRSQSSRGEKGGEKNIVSALEGAARWPISPRFALPWRIRISMRIRIGISAENSTPRLASNTRFRSRVFRKTHTAEIYREPGEGRGRGNIYKLHEPEFSIAPFVFLRPTIPRRECISLLAWRPPRVHGEMCLPSPSPPQISPT